MKGLTPLCPYCQEFSTQVTGEAIYPHRRDLHHKAFYQCAPCDAYVGTHDGTRKPLGRLADAELRQAKVRAHAAFDPLWRNNPDVSRRDAYHRLALCMGLAPEDCHIGMFTIEQCQCVETLCREGRLKL